MKMLDRLGKVLVILLMVLTAGKAIAAEKPTTEQKTCVTAECHTDYAEGKKEHVHGPVSLGDCKSCHEAVAVEKHTWKLAREGRDLCESCHLDQANKKLVHDPVKKGNCLKCHEPHNSDNKFLLNKKSVAEVCKDCHQITRGLDFLHGPTAVGECTVCHDSHSSDHKHMLVEDHSTLCFSCHEITADELEKYDVVHEPAKNDCIGCHDPHGASNARMVKSVAPFLCYTCHKDIQKIAENSAYQHTVVSDIDGCLKCHTPHASTAKFLLKKDATGLCMTCHDKPQGISKDETLPAFTEQIKDKKFKHGPVADNDCSGCHVTHGSKYFRLLAKDYPEVFYAPYADENYALCFSCHEKTLVQTEKTDNLTDFRNGLQNLHFLHVNKERRGRTCRACHQTHASNQPKHIRKSVPYGKWELPVGFAKTETGGSCKSGCHVQKAYDRKKPVDYSAQPEENK